MFSFSFPRNWNRYIFFEPIPPPPPPPPLLPPYQVLHSNHAKFYQFFPFINFSCEGSFFFSQPSKCLSADRLRCEHRRFYTCTYVGIVPFVPYIFAGLGPHGELLTKRTSFLVQPSARLTRIVLRNCQANLACKSTRNPCVRATLGHFQTVAFDPTQDELNQDKMADMIAAGAHGVSNSRL